MKFIVESAKRGCARLGVLQKNEQIKCDTPLLLIYTKAGSIPYLSHEVFQYLNIDPSTVGILVPLDTINHMHKSLAKCDLGIIKFAGWRDDFISVATLKNPAELCPSGYHDREQISIFGRAGRKTLNPSEYMDLVDVCRPDVLHPLCDGDTMADSKKKRLIKAVDRSETFLTKCLEHFRKSTNLKNSMFFASVEGGYNIIARQNMIQNMNEPEIEGYFLDGFHTNGESVALITAEENNFAQVVKHCIDALPADRPKLILGAYNPITVLKLIELGVDVFDSSYSYLATMANCALTFNFDVNAENVENAFDLNLGDDQYRDDFEPILNGCKCLTCSKHTRAYIHHMINTKELLAPMLLMIHNTHHHIEFFRAIRNSIRHNGNVTRLRELVERQYKVGSKFQTKIIGKCTKVGTNEAVQNVSSSATKLN